MSNDLIIIDIASALGPRLLDLVFKHRVNRVRRVQGRLLRDEIDFISLQLVQRLLTPLLDQILEDASAGKCVKLLNPLVVAVFEDSAPLCTSSSGGAHLLTAQAEGVIVVVARLDRVVSYLPILVFRSGARLSLRDIWKSRALRWLGRNDTVGYVKFSPLDAVDVKLAATEDRVVHQRLLLQRWRHWLSFVRLAVQEVFPIVLTLVEQL